MIEIGRRYFDARKRKGLTQEATAEIADITQQAISDAKLGRSFLSADSMLHLCTFYGCDSLLTGDISDKEL